jgi:hypothetical protein
VTLVGTPLREQTRARRQLYLERDSLIEMTERPVILTSRPLPGEQTQIVRWPPRKASGRRWIFIFGGAAATAMLLATWLGFSLRPGAIQRAQPASKEERGAGVEVTRAIAASPSRPIVAPLAERSAAPASLTPTVGAEPVPAGLTSGRHSRTASARLASPSRLATHHQPARPTRAKPTTVAWVDPFVDR